MRRLLRHIGELFMTIGERCIEASEGHLSVASRLRYLEQRHTKLEAMRIDDEIVVKGCTQVIRFPVSDLR